MEKSRSGASSGPCPSLPPLQAEIAKVEGLLGYRFSDASLIAEALTHPSVAGHASYRRLEFVGDAALGLAFAKHFFLTKPPLGPGKMTVLRAANTSNANLARVAVRHGLYRFLRRRNTPVLDQKVEEFRKVVEREGLSYGDSSVKERKVLANIVESIAAAVYVDYGFNLEKLWKVVRGILEPIITEETLEEQPVTALHLYCQKKGKSLDFKNRREESLNITDVFVDGELLGIGSSEQKDIAKLNAARDALQSLCSSEPIEMETDANMYSSLADGARKEKDGSKPVYRIETDQGPSHATIAAAEQGWRGLHPIKKIFVFFLIYMLFCFFFFPYEPKSTL